MSDERGVQTYYLGIFNSLDRYSYFIDFLADPFGYYLILSGLKLLVPHFPVSIKAKNTALILIIASIPSVFIDQNNQIGQLSFLSGWSLYFIIVGLLKIILVFFIFQVIMEIVKKYGNKDLISHSSKTFVIYMSVMFISSIAHSFSINFSVEQYAWITIITVILSIIIEIVFLMLLNSVGKLKSETKEVE